VFKCKLTPILESIFLVGQLGLMQTYLDRRAPHAKQKIPPSTPFQPRIKMLCPPQFMLSFLIGLYVYKCD